jgi:hypothetical protein
MNLGIALTWNGEVKTSDIVAAIAIMLTLTTATFAYRQLRIAKVNIQNVRKQLNETARTNRARFLFDILKWYLDNKTLRTMVYRLDYGEWEFDARTFPLSEDEPAIDHLLYVYDLIGYYAETGVIEEGELPIIRFEASRVLHNKEMIRYLAWLDNEFAAVGVAGPAYARARKLAEKVNNSR